VASWGRSQEGVGGVEEMDVQKTKNIEKVMTCGAHFTVTQRAKCTFYLPGPTCQDS
jgi:hypothetical protein